jgi:protein deglycase
MCYKKTSTILAWFAISRGCYSRSSVLATSSGKSLAAFASARIDYKLRRKPHTQAVTNTFFRNLSTSSKDDGAFNMAAKKVLVPIADGSEEIETTCIQDTLVRFGAKVTVASVKPGKELVCTMSRGIKFIADCTIDDVATEEFDLIVLPGGMPGAEHLRDCATLIQMLQKQKANGKWYAAICASPAVALQSNGLIDDDMIVTGYPAPAFQEKLSKYLTTNDDDTVVVSKNLITSKGPSTAILFGLQLGEALYGKDKRDEIASQMLVSNLI